MKTEPPAKYRQRIRPNNRQSSFPLPPRPRSHPLPDAAQPCLSFIRPRPAARPILAHTKRQPWQALLSRLPLAPLFHQPQRRILGLRHGSHRSGPGSPAPHQRKKRTHILPFFHPRKTNTSDVAPTVTFSTSGPPKKATSNTPARASTKLCLLHRRAPTAPAAEINGAQLNPSPSIQTTASPSAPPTIDNVIIHYETQ